MALRYFSRFIEQTGLLSEITNHKTLITRFIQRQLISVFSCRTLNWNRLESLHLTFMHKSQLLQAKQKV